VPRMMIATSPRLVHSRCNVLLPFSIAQSSIPLALTLRQSDLYWSFQLAPLESLGSERDEGAETAIDSRGRESRIRGREV
jgi:hypothetical protein